MTARATIRKADMIRAAEVAKQTGCKIEIKVGETTVTIYPEESKQPGKGIDYSRPVL